MFKFKTSPSVLSLIILTLFSERTLEITEKKRRCLYLKEEITIRHSEVKSLEHRQRELHMHLFRIRKENNRLRNTINQLNKIVDDFR